MLIALLYLPRQKRIMSQIFLRCHFFIFHLSSELPCQRNRDGANTSLPHHLCRRPCHSPGEGLLPLLRLYGDLFHRVSARKDLSLLRQFVGDGNASQKCRRNRLLLPCQIFRETRFKRQLQLSIPDGKRYRGLGLALLAIKEEFSSRLLPYCSSLRNGTAALWKSSVNS